MKKIPSIWLCILLLSVGCNKPAAPLDQDWSAPVKITETQDSLVGGIVLYNWNDTVIASQPQPNGNAKYFLMNSNEDSWKEVPFNGVPQGYFWSRPNNGESNDGVCFGQSSMENDQLTMSALVGRMSVEGGLVLHDVTEKKWLVDTKTLFGETPPNVKLTEPGRRSWPVFGEGILSGQDLYFPYCVQGLEVTYRGKTLITDGTKGPFADGVLHSADSGTTWQLERIADTQAWTPWVCKGRNFYYYFAAGFPPKKTDKGDQLWFSRKPVAGGSWDAPSPVTQTYVYSFAAVPEGDTLHLCWLDRRHEQTRISTADPHRANFEVVYCHRKESDPDWSKDVILSEDLFYAYAPTMAVEGNNIVVAWSGIQTAKDWHSNFDPNDIYYVTSKDGGRTWAKPLRVTDNIKPGITAGDAHVALRHGIIHLFYTEGKLNLKPESPGLVKLNQPPWPVYYQQRHFPE